MPITASDITFNLSGGASNSDPNASLGGAISSEAIAAGLHNLFDMVTGAESNAGDTEYRCFYIKNTHASLTLYGAKVWISANTPAAGSDISIGLGSAAIGAQEQSVVDESTPPGSVTFSQPANEGEALSIGDIPAGSHKAVWVKRVIAAGAAAYNSDSCTIAVSGDTAA